MGEHPWDRTHLACTRSPDTGCTRDACAPRRTLPMDQPRIFIGDTKIQLRQFGCASAASGFINLSSLGGEFHAGYPRLEKTAVAQVDAVERFRALLVASGRTEGAEAVTERPGNVNGVGDLLKIPGE